MDLYITEGRSAYKVANRDLERTLEHLREETGGSFRSEEYGEDTSVIVADEEMFGGDVPYSWHDNVTDFLEDYCLPGSYATFRDDEEFYWYMAVLGEDGKARWDEKPIDNPFGHECDELDEAKGCRHEFNVHLEWVYHVETASNKDKSTVAEAIAKAGYEGRLQLAKGSLLRVEVWDGTSGELMAERDQWS